MDGEKGSDSITVKYDPMGNRVYKPSYDASSTTVQKFIVDIAGSLPTIIAEYSDPNSFTNSYIYADAQILVQYAHSGDPNAADDKYYYVHDRLGSVRMVVDCNTVAETVTSRNTYTYSPFGNPYAGELSETVYNPFQFTGQWLDVEIDQYYLRARMYDPKMMRFTTRDPVRGKYKEPLTLHKYLYCVNDPINNWDLTGRLVGVALSAKMRAADTKMSLGVKAWAAAKLYKGLIAFNAGVSGTINAITGPENVDWGVKFTIGAIAGAAEMELNLIGMGVLGSATAGAFTEAANMAAAGEDLLSPEGVMHISIAAGMGTVTGIFSEHMDATEADEKIALFLLLRARELWTFTVQTMVDGVQ